MNPYTKSKLDTFLLVQTGIEVSHGSKNSQPSPYCSLGIVFMCLGIAKVHEESIPQELGDMPIVALDNHCTGGLICTYHIPVLFRIELAGELRRVHQITEHHGELAAFGVGWT